MVVIMARGKQQGMVYLWALFLVFLLGLGLGKSLEVYSTTLQRDKEQELLDVGRLYKQAIYNYYLSSPGYEKKFPTQLSDLLKDPRYLTTRRYLRKLYLDPITQQAFMPIYAPQGGIMGVYSPSTRTPLKQRGFMPDESHFNQAQHYKDWGFRVMP
ncbi:type II secretory pathway pseudopilin PulG [Agitococcus lubricus]|uniref:Type II secretory pathway pseudopilin PulG n=2 Tax=Agitococcus lubricus TaxID=1077255 RepID=A0A2T5J259_9GAMM|nr:type II secretory pathway pseudopilin PulG [Agitococcus lubricus]